MVVLNGTKTVDVQHAQFTEGPISLQFGNREKGSPGRGNQMAQSADQASVIVLSQRSSESYSSIQKNLGIELSIL